MPTIIDYPTVLKRMTAAGFRCNYPNSGAFGFPPSANAKIRGWIGPADATIKPSLAPQVISVSPAYETNLTQAAARVRQNVLPGAVWVMPLSHWHFELHDGSRDWLAAKLRQIHVDPALLENRADGSAVEFSQAESFEPLLLGLLENLRVSDFLFAFPDHPVLCTVHHHTQLWWMTPDARLLARIDEQLMVR